MRKEIILLEDHPNLKLQSPVDHCFFPVAIDIGFAIEKKFSELGAAIRRVK